MIDTKKTLTVHVNVEMAPSALQSIVQNTKAHAGRNEKGVYPVDTADAVSAMISKFLQEKDFDRYVSDQRNYPR